MSYVIYNKETTYILRAPGRSVGCYVESYKTERAAKAALTRLTNSGKLGSNFENVPHTYPNGVEGTKRVETPYVKEDFAIASSCDFHENIEKMVTRINLMSGEPFEEPINTPYYLSPASETYWCR